MLIQSSPGYQVKHGKLRQVPLNKAAMAIVKKQNKESEFGCSQIRMGKSKLMNWFLKNLKGYVRLCKLSEELHFHSLRATFATWAIATGDADLCRRK